MRQLIYSETGVLEKEEKVRQIYKEKESQKELSVESEKPKEGE